MGLAFIIFVILRYAFSTPSFFGIFVINKHWILFSLFCIDKNDHWFLSLTLFLSWITLIYLYILNQSWIPQIKPNWWWFRFLSMVFFKFEELYCENLHIYSSRKFTYSFHCLVFSISSYGLFHFPFQGNANFVEWAW